MQSVSVSLISRLAVAVHTVRRPPNGTCIVPEETRLTVGNRDSPRPPRLSPRLLPESPSSSGNPAPSRLAIETEEQHCHQQPHIQPSRYPGPPSLLPCCHPRPRAPTKEAITLPSQSRRGPIPLASSFALSCLGRRPLPIVGHKPARPATSPFAAGQRNEAKSAKHHDHHSPTFSI